SQLATPRSHSCRSRKAPMPRMCRNEAVSTPWRIARLPRKPLRLFLGHLGQERHVRLAEGQPGQLAARHPAQLLCGERARVLPLVQPRPVEGQLDLQVGIDVLDARVQLADLDADAQLLPQLPGESRALSFARLHLAAGKLPEAGALALLL